MGKITTVLISVLVVGFQNVVANQQPFNLDYEGQVSPLTFSPSGTLRRFSHPDSLESILDVAQSHDLDIWQLTSSYVDIYLPPGKVLPKELEWIKYTKSEIDQTQHESLANVDSWNLSSIGPTNNTFHASYHPLHEIDMFIHELAASFPEKAKVFALGHTAEGREMLGIQLSKISKSRKKSKKKSKSKTAKLGFVISGAQHAREWVATAASLYLAHALVTTLEPLLDEFDFYLIPTPNPDGYIYTWESERFWYKNRQIMGPHGYKWKPQPTGGGDNARVGSRHPSMNYDSIPHRSPPEDPEPPVDPCSFWYPGHRPFESPEVNNVANFITTLPNLRAFLDLRAYGQMLSAPYSYSCTEDPRDAENQMEAATGAAQALGSVHGTKVTVGTLCEQLYQAPGNIVDWMYQKAKIEFSYALHLRDTGTYGFSLPAEWIRPVGEETGEMVRYLTEFIRDLEI